MPISPAIRRRTGIEIPRVRVGLMPNRAIPAALVGLAIRRSRRRMAAALRPPVTTYATAGTVPLTSSPVCARRLTSSPW